MKPKYFFSVIIPTLNEEKYLPNLLDDLNRQTYRDFEVIVVDGGSEDKTVAVAQQFGNRLTLMVLTANERNVSSQRNLGALRARSGWLIFMDADDRLPNYFLEGIKYRLLLTQADIFTCWLKPDSKRAGDGAFSTLFNLVLEGTRLTDIPAALGALIGIKKSAFKKVGGFNPTIAFAEDRAFVQAAVKAGFRFRIFRDPQFIYSLRRFRTLGNLKVVQRYARLNLKRLTKAPIEPEEYPMGGNAFKGADEPTRRLLDKIQQYWIRMAKQPRVLKKLRALLEQVQDSV
ncbi:hypothetical protein A3A66_03335 [Microgenomates group bacterium RIFCSPLOWO2_01_FULL_46_13]|nr:MAG: hypothetical protein A2783_04510 [Microgenomates group bacterium RIFCSPHIGHO2_01_FULL_45_11]OGV95026.1 MAG: hypothetical protein A3A66_03335 [Microgenomates group bacterium RIFCSPLOWO2_01_FULL_46_13]